MFTLDNPLHYNHQLLYSMQILEMLRIKFHVVINDNMSTESFGLSPISEVQSTASTVGDYHMQ